jgi:hypothetical protein
MPVDPAGMGWGVGVQGGASPGAIRYFLFTSRSLAHRFR